MKLIGVKTRRFKPPKDSLDELLSYVDSRVGEQSVVAISSKVCSICTGDCIPIDSVNKETLEKSESLNVLTHKDTGEILLTQKADMLVEYGGVDTVYGGKYYVTLPKTPYKTAMEIWQILKKRNKLKSVGVIITDSHSVPFRKGSVGLAVAGYGFKPTYTRKQKGATADMIDGLAASANIVMGESDNHMPITIISGIPDIKFFKKPLPPSIMRSYMYVRNNEVYNFK